jgi:hypothetical protein
MRNSRAAWVGVALGVPLAWCSAVWGPICLAGTPLLLGFSAWLAARRLWLPLTILGALSPFALAVLFGAVAYARGTARLRTVGYPDLGLSNVDPVSRYQSVSSGCMVDGSEWVLHLPYNATLRVLKSALGPMPRTYDGPFPTEHEARRALRASTRLTWAALRNERFVLGGRTIHLRPGVGSSLAALARTFDDSQGPGAAMWQGRALVLQVPQQPGADLIVLIDADSGKVVAYYGNVPSDHRRLPAQWS